MSVLESLYILVKLETEELKKGLADTKAQVKGLESEFENLGRAGDNAALSFDHVLKSAVGLFAGFASFGAILSGAKGTVAGIREVGQAARELNVDVSTLDAWGAAVTRMGGSASGFQSSIESLSKHFGSTNATALQALPKLADAFSKLNFTQAQNYGKSLGLDQSTILLLQQGRREVEATIRQQRELGVVTKEQAENTRKFDLALDSLGRVFQSIQREFTLPGLPLLTEAFKYIVLHKDLITGALIGIGSAVAIMGASFLAANPALVAAATAITAISLAYEDYQAMKRGDDSFIGGIIKDSKTVSAGAPGTPGYVEPDIGRYFHLPRFLGGEGYDGKSSSASARPTSVTIGEIVINTQARDAAEISKELGVQIGQALSQIDNGVHK